MPSDNCCCADSQQSELYKHAKCWHSWECGEGSGNSSKLLPLVNESFDILPDTLGNVFLANVDSAEIVFS